MTPRREDYESTDLEGAAYLAREDAEDDYEKPSRAELAAEDADAKAKSTEDE